MDKLVVNGRTLSQPLTGVQRYTRELLDRLDLGLAVERPRRPIRGLAGHLWEQLSLPRRVAGRRLWSPANTGPLRVKDQVLTVHDLAPLEHPEWFLSSFALWYRLLWPTLLRRVSKVIVPSAFVAQQIQARFPNLRVRIIPQGVDHARFRPNAGTRPSGLPERYILFVGTLEPRKNLEGLLQAWSEVQRTHPDTWLVIVGARGKVFPAVQASAIAGTLWLGYVPDERLPALYGNALCLVLPSLYEGFGLPALEAMACGTPLIVSDGGALPEVTGDAALQFRLAEPSGLAGCLEACLHDPALRAHLRQKGLSRAAAFSWEQTAALTWRELHAA